MIQEARVEDKDIGQASIQEITDSPHKETKIVVIGIGGGGSNMVRHLIETSMHHGVIPIVANTDEQHLQDNPTQIKIRLGKEVTNGLGAGGDPKVGKSAAEESADEIRKFAKGANLVIVCTGLGGGTGTGAIPVVADIAKKEGALTVAVVTKPFRNEGRDRTKKAESGLEELKSVSDSIVVIPNEKLRSTMKPAASIDECFREVDDVLVRAVSGISGIITQKGKVNVDFADLRTVLGFKGFALMGIGEAIGENAAVTAMENAIQSPLLDNISINGAMGVIACFEYPKGYPAAILWAAQDIIYERAHEDSMVKFSYIERDTLPADQVRVTLIATGSEKSKDEEPTPLENIATATQSTIKPRMVVNGGRIPTSEEDLDIPAYLRNQKD
ncbi:cell division protein FtsZ [Helicobacter cetorum]|uniref:cell division protein FtsZ n=1 Tax=Helicobacter cetorum TaxID=138563 RepID=UPI000CF1AD69|nr:cell division protein FtsZ [Helicobacter cetorum]